MTILAVVFLLLTVVLFYVAMSEVTKVGVGAFSGSSELPVSLPGESEQITMTCAWGPGVGMYLTLVAIIGLLVFPLKPLAKKIRKHLVMF